MSDPSTPDVTELSQKGYQLLKEGFLDQAETHFRRILETEPSNNYALVGLGDTERKRHNPRNAAEYYKRCLEHHPDNNYALFGLADCYKSMRHYHRAIKIWERYLKHDDRNVTVLTRVADAYRKIRDKAHSQQIYQRVLEMEPDNPYALIGLGHLCYDFREYEQALGYWHRMREIDGSAVDIRVLTSIGNCYRKLKQFQDGIPFFREALAREPNNFYGLFGLADCYRGLNQPEQSLSYWNRILANDPVNKVILTRAGDAYRSLRKPDRAQEYYRKALAIDYDVYAILGLALIDRQNGRYDQAITALRELVKREPENPRLVIELAQTLVHAGEPEEAIAALHTFRDTGTANPFVQELLSRLTS